MDYIVANWADIIAILTGVVTTASIIAKMTITETDNKYVGYALKFIDFLAINNKPTEVK